MKRHLFSILIIISFTIPGTLLGQTVEGNWYTPIRNKLLHVIISTDSIVVRKCSFDSLRDYGYAEDMAFKIERKVKTTYIVSSAKDTVPAYYLFSFIPDNTGSKIFMSIESFTSKFPTLSDAEKGIAEFEQNPLQIVFLNKQEIDKIRKKKTLSSMTAADFKKFATTIIEIDSANAQYAKKKYRFAYLYGESISRLLLSELGFNSLVKGDQYDEMLDTFYENPETQQLLIRMATKPK